MFLSSLMATFLTIHQRISALKDWTTLPLFIMCGMQNGCTGSLNPGTTGNRLRSISGKHLEQLSHAWQCHLKTTCTNATWQLCLAAFCPPCTGTTELVCLKVMSGHFCSRQGK